MRGSAQYAEAFKNYIIRPEHVFTKEEVEKILERYIRIREDLRVDTYLEKMTALISDEARAITVNWSGRIAGDVFSGSLEAETTVKNVLSTPRLARARAMLASLPP